MVSIMPGMDAAAPDRTETRSGFSLLPKTLPVSFWSRSMLRWTSFMSPVGRRLPAL